MRKVAIIGAAGYTGVELTRLVAGHPRMDLVMVTSDSDAGRPVSDLYPALEGVDLTYAEHDVAAVAGVADVAFLAVPHTAAMSLAAPLLDAGVTVIDLSADFRFEDPDIYESWYGTPHEAPELLAQAVYGLPEIDRTGLPGADLVACPGCYPTASLLAAVPALESGIGTGKVVIDAKSGVSGAGRAPGRTSHFATANESIGPYGVPHRHTPEIAAGLARAAGRDMPLAFVPHLAPMTRGLLSTVYLDAAEGLTTEAAYEIYSRRYSGEPFITVHDVGRWPSTGEVRGTNRAHLGVSVDTGSDTLVVACVIDNLVKGAGGQAVQCANIALDMPEAAGLGLLAPVV